MNPENAFLLIREEAKKEGELLIGSASLDGEEQLDPKIKKSFPLNFAISLALPLSLEVLQTVSDRPTVLYKHHYQQANYLLDRASFRISQVLAREGYRALPIPASILVAWNEKRAHLDHRLIAFKASLGWWGKCNLIIHP